MSIEWLGLPSSLDIVIDHTLEAADACGCISMEKASAERSTLNLSTAEDHEPHVTNLIQNKPTLAADLF